MIHETLCVVQCNRDGAAGELDAAATKEAAKVAGERAGGSGTLFQRVRRGVGGTKPTHTTAMNVDALPCCAVVTVA